MTCTPAATAPGAPGLVVGRLYELDAAGEVVTRGPEAAHHLRELHDVAQEPVAELVDAVLLPDAPGRALGRYAYHVEPHAIPQHGVQRRGLGAAAPVHGVGRAVRAAAGDVPHAQPPPRRIEPRRPAPHVEEAREDFLEKPVATHDQDAVDGRRILQRHRLHMQLRGARGERDVSQARA